MLKVIAGIGFLIVFLIAGLLLLVLTNDRSSILTANLPSNALKHRKAFERNVEDKFSSKYSAEQLRAELSAIGFNVKYDNAEFINQRFFYFCPTTYHITWESGESETVKVVKGSVHFTC